MKKKQDRVCEDCKWYFYDNSVGMGDCENDDIDEESSEKYFTQGEEGCPFWEKNKYLEDDILSHYKKPTTLKSPYNYVRMSISSEKVRALCIRNNWYTRGDAYEYSLILGYCQTCKDDEYIDDCVYTVAKDIYEHSDMSVDTEFTPEEYIAYIMVEIFNNCIETIVKENKEV